jgi:hypothetical protein
MPVPPPVMTAIFPAKLFMEGVYPARDSDFSEW